MINFHFSLVIYNKGLIEVCMYFSAVMPFELEVLYVQEDLNNVI